MKDHFTEMTISFGAFDRNQNSKALLHMNSVFQCLELERYVLYA